MKMVGYALFGIAILLLSVFLLAPEKKAPETVAPPKATMTNPDPEAMSADVTPNTSEPEETPAEKMVETHELTSSKRETSGTQDREPSDTEKLQGQQDLLSSPGDLGPNMSGPPDFPSFPPMEADEGSPFSEFPSQDFPDDSPNEDPFGDAGEMTFEGTEDGGLDQREF